MLYVSTGQSEKCVWFVAGGGYRIVLSGIAWFGLKPRVLHGMALCWVVFFGIACY